MKKAISPWKEILNKVSEKDGGQHGTALFLLDLRRDLKLLINKEKLGTQNHEVIASERDLIDTLRGFTNPYVEKDQNFSYEILRLSTIIH